MHQTHAQEANAWIRQGGGTQRPAPSAGRLKPPNLLRSLHTYASGQAAIHNNSTSTLDLFLVRLLRRGQHIASFTGREEL